MKLYLITGLRGAGKTTFLKQFVRQFQNQKLWLIINDFGKVGVDGALLREVNAELAEISNGSIFCTCRLDKFEETLHRAMEDRPDVIVVEASGLADPTGVERVLGQPEFSGIAYSGSICLVDALRLERVIHTARVLPKQIRVSSLVLINKADLATPEQLEETEKTVYQCNPLAAIRKTQFGQFEPQWMEQIYPLLSGAPDRMPDIQLQKYTVRRIGPMTEAQLRSALKIMAEESWRIKGFVCLEGVPYLVNCVGPSIELTKTEEHIGCEDCLVLLAGPAMALRKAIAEAVRWYPQLKRE